MAAQLLGFELSDVMMVAAHPPDLQAASRAGLKTAYVPRPLEHGAERRAAHGDGAGFDVVASDFLDLAAKLGA